jgi:hypothetical protein
MLATHQFKALCKVSTGPTSVFKRFCFACAASFCLCLLWCLQNWAVGMTHCVLCAIDAPRLSSAAGAVASKFVHVVPALDVLLFT